MSGATRRRLGKRASPKPLDILSLNILDLKQFAGSE
jgi:hypothetical protein